MTNIRLATILAACCALLAPELAAAQTEPQTEAQIDAQIAAATTTPSWTQIKNASVDTEDMVTPLTATNFPTSGKDNIDVYAVWGDETSPRVTSCGPVVGTTCPTFKPWVAINPGTLPGGTGYPESAVGWGTTPSTAHREVFVQSQDPMTGNISIMYSTRDGNQAWSDWISLGAPSGNGTCLSPFIPPNLLSAPQAISQGPNMISVFVVGPDCNLWINYFQRDSNGNLNWSGWLNVTGPGLSPLTNNILSVGQMGSSIAAVYSNFSTTNPTQTALNQIHLLVVAGSPIFGQPEHVLDANYFADASINYDPTPGINWAFPDTGATVDFSSTSWNVIGAAATPPGAIAVFADQGKNDSFFGNLEPLLGQQLIEEDGSIPGADGVLTVNGPLESDDGFLAAPVPVTLGKQGADCDTSRSCKNAVFFITDINVPGGNTKGGNIQYSIWGVAKPADAWTNGIKRLGKASDLFNGNPAAVVSQNGTTVYVFGARTNPSLCPGTGNDCGNVYYFRFTP
jgi:hypothetical protein